MSAFSDQQERAEALDPGRSFIVQAPAGSGKTEILVQRYLKLLSRESQPDAVLAITFTRKAAAEMRERVARSLGEAASEHQDAPPHRRLSLELAQAVLEQSRKKGWDLPDNPARLRIVTIDSLGSWLAASSPVSSGGGALGNLRRDAVPLYQEAARNLLQDGVRNGDEDVQDLLRDLDGSGRQFTERVAAMLARREQWREFLRVEDLATALDPALGERVKGECKPLLERLEQWRGEFEQLFADQWALEEKSVDPSSPEALPAWRRAADDLLTKKDQWRARFPKKLGGKLSGKLEKALRESGEFRERLARLRALESHHYQDAELQRVQSVLRVLRNAFAQLKVLFAERRETDYTEVSRAALEALGHDDRPSLLAERLDRRLKHILVDEFQDTSRAQLDLLERMIEDWRDGRRPHDFHGWRPHAIHIRLSRSRHARLSERSRIRLGEAAPHVAAPARELPLLLQSGGLVQPHLSEGVSGSGRRQIGNSSLQPL